MWFRNSVFKKGFILNFTLNYDERLDFLMNLAPPIVYSVKV